MGTEAKRRGLVIVNTGDGKGKTTAALGILMRAWGRGMRVVMVQWVKHRTGNWGEIRAAKKMGVEVIPMGAGFTWIPKKEPDTDARLAREAWALAREKVLSDQYDVVILDEITYALNYGWLDLEEVLDVLRRRPPRLHVVLTGRNAPQELIDFADLVTEMRLVKHPYRDQGVPAQPGIEF